MFARLTTQSLATPSRATEGISVLGPDKSVFLFEDRGSAADTPKKLDETHTANLPTSFLKPKQPQPAMTIALPEKKPEKAKKVSQLEQSKNINKYAGKSLEDIENDYLHKARDYVDALPGSKGTTANTFKIVSEKLRTSYILEAKLDAKKNEILKARYVFAVINYVNKVLKKGGKSLTANFVKQVLEENDGDFLSLCATLVDEKYLALENIDEISGLCNTILDILPTAEPALKDPIRTAKLAATAATVEDAKTVSKDPVDSMEVWPSPEKRETGE